MSLIPADTAEVPAKIVALFFTIDTAIWLAVRPATVPGTVTPKNCVAAVEAVPEPVRLIATDDLGYWK